MEEDQKKSMDMNRRNKCEFRHKKKKSSEEMKLSCCIVGTNAILAVNQPFYDIDDCKEVRGGGGG